MVSTMGTILLFYSTFMHSITHETGRFFAVGFASLYFLVP